MTIHSVKITFHTIRKNECTLFDKIILLKNTMEVKVWTIMKNEQILLI